VETLQLPRSLHSRLTTKWTKLKVKVKVTLRLTVSQSVSLGSSPRPDIYYTSTVTVLFLWGALSDERTGLSFVLVYAAGPRQRSLSLGPSPVGLVTIFYCLIFETSLFVASYDSQGHGGGIRLHLHTGEFSELSSKHRPAYNPSARTNRKHSSSTVACMLGRYLATAISMAPQFFLWANMPQYDGNWLLNRTGCTRRKSWDNWRHCPRKVVCREYRELQEFQSEYSMSWVQIRRVTAWHNCPRVLTNSLSTLLATYFHDFLAWLIFRPWRWRQHVHPKRWLTFNELHGVMCQKRELFTLLTHFNAYSTTTRNPYFLFFNSW
jgi:hypothetical protein